MTTSTDYCSLCEAPARWASTRTGRRYCPDHAGDLAATTPMIEIEGATGSVLPVAPSHLQLAFRWAS